MDPENLPPRKTPWYSLKQRNAFLGGVDGQLPPFHTGPQELEKLAKTKLSERAWYYVSSNAGQSLTHRANREAFYRWRIIPRMIKNTNNRDLSITLFDHEIPAPILFAPVGVNQIYHPEGELPVAKVAGELGLPYCLSTAGSQPIEAVGKANGNGPRFFQLYCPHNDELAISLMTRAFKSGFDVCMMTLDTPQLAWRHNDIATANYTPYYGQAIDLGMSDPVFQKIIKERGLDPVKDVKKCGQLWIDSVWHGKAHDPSKLTWIMKQWKKISGGRPFLLKGIQRTEDALFAIDMGCDGIVVSNHAGRQCDGATGSLDQLPEIVDACAGRPDFTILFDSGVRSGADVFKALALGAKAVMVGRLYIYGLSILGERGVRHVMESLLAEYDLTLHMSGHNGVHEMNRQSLKFIPHAGSSATKL